MGRPLALLLALAAFGSAQQAFVRVAATNTPRPDGNGTFNLNIFESPAMDGTRIVFSTIAANASIWTFDLATGEFLKLVDTSMAAPGGTGNFTDFGSLSWRPLLKDGTVAFLGYDSKPQRPNAGLYTIPANGGPITRIANYNTTSPSGGLFGEIDGSSRRPFGAFALFGNRVVFSAVNAGGGQGIYSANVDGSALRLIADRNVVFPLPRPALRGVDLWSNPWLWRDTLIFYGQTITDPSTGYNGIYTLPPTGGGIPAELFNSLRALPGNSNGNFHTRLRTPTLQVEDQTIAFVADDPTQAADRRFRGLFTMPLGGGALRNIADLNSTLPGMGALTPTSFASYSLNGGRILFRAVGGPKEGFSGGEQALMMWENGVITKVIAAGDMLDGRIVRQVFDISPLAMSGGRFTFLVDFAAFPGPSLAIYAAVPVSATSVTGLQNTASYTENIVTPGGIVNVYGNEQGTASLTTFSPDAAGRIPTALSNARILFNGEPAPILFSSATQSGVIAPFLLDGAVRADVVVQYQGRVSMPFTVQVRAADPGLFSADRSGTGPGAILNEDGSVNTTGNPAGPGSIVVLFGAGFGQTNPASVAGTITPAANPPRLRSAVTVTIGGQPAQILYQGPAPGAVAGLYQFNVRIPAGAAAGNQPVKITMGGAASQDGLTVAVAAP